MIAPIMRAGVRRSWLFAFYLLLVATVLLQLFGLEVAAGLPALGALVALVKADP